MKKGEVRMKVKNILSSKINPKKHITNIMTNKNSFILKGCLDACTCTGNCSN